LLKVAFYNICFLTQYATRKDSCGSGVSRDAISKYERDDIVPSVENANKIAKVLGVSLDYLMSEDDNLEVVDIDMLNRMKEIQRLSEDDKSTVTKIIDAFIRDTKTKKAYA